MTLEAGVKMQAGAQGRLRTLWRSRRRTTCSCVFRWKKNNRLFSQTELLGPYCCICSISPFTTIPSVCPEITCSSSLDTKWSKNCCHYVCLGMGWVAYFGCCNNRLSAFVPVALLLNHLVFSLGRGYR